MTVLSGPGRQEYVLFSPATCDDESHRQEKEKITTSARKEKAAELNPPIQQYWHEQAGMNKLPMIKGRKRGGSPDVVERRGAKRQNTKITKRTNKYKYISLMECSLHIHELVNVYAVR